VLTFVSIGGDVINKITGRRVQQTWGQIWGRRRTLIAREVALRLYEHMMAVDIDKKTGFCSEFTASRTPCICVRTPHNLTTSSTTLQAL
jgi:hypothetical protein